VSGNERNKELFFLIGGDGMTAGARVALSLLLF
jgi:hypothetical protein